MLTENKYDINDDRWNKVKILEEAIDPFNGWAFQLDYVVWIDGIVLISTTLITCILSIFLFSSGCCDTRFQFPS